MQRAVGVMMLFIIAGLVAYINQAWLQEQYHRQFTMGIKVLTAAEEMEKAAKPGPKATFKECAHGCPTMVVVPTGTFKMGSPEGQGVDDERPQRDVTIARPFAVGRTEVTFAEWDMCVKAGACAKISDNGWGRNDRPAILMSWWEAKQYVDWLKRMTGKDYRLLTEAEWEYAARAGSTTHWSFGDEEKQLGEHAWFSSNSQSRTQPVARKKPNAFGLFDMHGNVWEWTADPWHDSYQGAPTDGMAWIEGGDASRRVVRGGSWYDNPDFLRSALRDRSTTDVRSRNLGFRVGRTLTP
ncbi:MAG: formylglycine-generating enzyme family protein [Hyphomicrobiaceae bacterium]|nr:MAG: formylglycine-generating enzyme family protein [Hyphomicrobiaceae bacterium]